MWLGVLNATAYAVAMAYLESAIVVYLRRLYYPKGFDFPLVIIDIPTLLIEVGRETATIIMLATVGVAAGRTKVGKCAYFLYLTMDVVPRLPDNGILLAQWTPASYRWWMLLVGQALAIGTFISWAWRASASSSSGVG